MRALGRASRGERGSAQVFLVFTVVTLILVVGLVVDGAGKVAAATQAQSVAASAARAATNAISSGTLAGSALAIDPDLAERVALDYVTAAGMTGTASVAGTTITVTTEAVYATRFMSLIGLTSITVDGTAQASLIDGPGP